MKSWAGLMGLLAFSSAALAVDYKEGWTAEVFYNELATCRTAIVFPAVKAYMDRKAAKVSAEKLRSDVISILPALEHPALTACYCMVNEAAKAQDYKSYAGDFTSRMRILKEKLDGPACNAKFQAAAAELDSKEAIEAMSLK